MELRYMDAGDEAQERQQGLRITNSHVIHHDFGHRYAHPALG